MIDYTEGLALVQPHDPGGYVSAEDLLLIADLDEQDICVKRWKRGGQPLRLRVKALDFDQQEKIERAALVKLPDGQVVRSEARFAALTLFEGVIVPKLTLEQAHAMRKHNPSIITEIVKFIWYHLSTWDQEIVNKIINEQIPGAAEPAGDAPADGAGDGDATLESADRLLEWEPATV